jgi:hypothetical protein
MRTPILLVLQCLILCIDACAQDALFVAHVKNITLEPRGGQYRPDLCADNGRRNTDGSTYICMSNDGGCETTELVTERVLQGDMQLGPQQLKARIGEWGGTRFPLMHKPILVHLHGNAVHWIPIDVNDGRQWVSLRSLRLGPYIGSLDLRTLPQEREGYVALDAISEQLQPKR